MHRVGHHLASAGHHLRVPLILGLLLPLLASPGAGLAGQVASEVDRPPLDLAAMALTPADIDAADLTWKGSGDYGVRSSRLLYGDAYAAFAATFLFASEERLAATLEEAGLIRAHDVLLSSRMVADGDAGRDILSSVVEFADRDGAATAWAFLRDLPRAGQELEAEGLDAIGEDAYAIREAGDDPETGDPYAIIETGVLVGRFHLGVMLVDWGGTEPALADAEALTLALAANVDEARHNLTPGLSNQVLRLTGETVNTTSDTYTLREGRAISLFNDTVDAVEIEEHVATMGLTDDYRVWQELVPDRGKQGDDSVYYLSVMQFVDDDAAASWLAARPDEIDAYEHFTDVAFVAEDEVDYGDAAFSYTATSANTGTHFHNVTVQVDDQIVILDVSGPTTAPVEAIAPLVEAQLACLEAGECLEPVALPEALQEFVEEI